MVGLFDWILKVFIFQHCILFSDYNFDCCSCSKNIYNSLEFLLSATIIYLSMIIFLIYISFIWPFLILSRNFLQISLHMTAFLHCSPLQYSWLDNPMDIRAWQATVRRVAKSWTGLKQLSNNSSGYLIFYYLIHFFFFLATLCSLRDLSSLTRDWTWVTAVNLKAWHPNREVTREQLWYTFSFFVLLHELTLLHLHLKLSSPYFLFQLQFIF